MEFSRSFLDLIKQSDLVTKIVLLILLGMSVLCWALFLYKFILLKIKKKQLRHVSILIKKAQSLEEVRSLAVVHAPTFPGYIIARILVMAQRVLAENKYAMQPSSKDPFLLEHGAEQVMQEIVSDEESYFALFSGCATVSPLLGLFGTVWGLIHAFMRIAEKQQADIVTVSPGIAEALITTLAGLLVAIPAVLMFCYLANELRKLQTKMYTFVDVIIWLMNGTCN